MLGERALGRVALANSLLAPGIVHVADLCSRAQGRGRSLVSRHKNVPGLALVVAIVAGDRNRASEIAQIVPVLAADTEPDEFSPLHNAVQMIVSGQRSQRTGENSILPRHHPRQKFDPWA